MAVLIFRFGEKSEDDTPWIMMNHCEILMEVNLCDIVMLDEKIRGGRYAEETEEALPISGVRGTHGFFLLSGASEADGPAV